MAVTMSDFIYFICTNKSQWVLEAIYLPYTFSNSLYLSKLAAGFSISRHLPTFPTGKDIADLIGTEVQSKYGYKGRYFFFCIQAFFTESNRAQTIQLNLKNDKHFACANIKFMVVQVQGKKVALPLHWLCRFYCFFAFYMSNFLHSKVYKILKGLINTNNSKMGFIPYGCKFFGMARSLTLSFQFWYSNQKEI